MSDQAQHIGLPTAPPRASTTAAAGDDLGAPSSSTAPAPTTSSMDINNGITIEGEPSRKRQKPSSSTGEITHHGGGSAAPTSATAAGGGGSAVGGGSRPSSSTKRRATGILSTALGWARSQAGEIANFQETKAAEGPAKPLPPLPLPTRRLAAAHHDMVKAMKTQGRGGSGGGSSTRISTLDLRQQQHPVAVAFATGTDPQLASVLGAELARLGDLAQADPAKYAALAEECKLWAAGTASSVAGLTTTDLEQAQRELKASMQHLPFSTTGAGGASGGGNNGNMSNGVPMPDPRASSYFIQPGTGGSGHPRPSGGGGGGGGGGGIINNNNDATTHNRQLLNNSYGQYYHPQAYTGPGPSRFAYQPPHVFNNNNNNNNIHNVTGAGNIYNINASGVVNHRYPRRSSRARNVKRNDMYLTLDSDDDEDDNNNELDNDRDDEDEQDDEDDGDRYGEGGGRNSNRRSRSGEREKRGPGRPRKSSFPPPYNPYQDHQHQQQQHQRHQGEQQYSPNLMSSHLHPQHPPTISSMGHHQHLHPPHNRMHPHSKMTPSISPAVAGAALAGAVAGSLAYFSPQLGDVLSPFAQFLFEHTSPDGVNPALAGAGNTSGAAGGAVEAGNPGGNDATAAAAAAAVDAVDYAALDEFISGLNFTNDAFLGSPSAMEMLAGVKAAVVAANTTATATAAEGVVVQAGMIPTIEAGVASSSIHLQNEHAENNNTTTAITPPPTGPQAISQINNNTGAAAAAAADGAAPAVGNHATHHHHSPSLAALPAPAPPQPVLPILDLAICKPLETPTVAGMLSLGLSKKSPTPLTSPLLSPTLLNLNF